MPDPHTLVTLPSIRGPGDALRDLVVALPPGYLRSRRRYPVAYLQDGQNLFDPATAFAGDWGLLEALAAEGGECPVILVGVPNLGPGRLREYSPFDDPVRGIGEGVGYLQWLTGTVKPLVDRTFRTRPERRHTAVGGSSMGGLFATYAVVAGAATFGAAWALSPAYWYADGRVYTWLGRQPAPVGRIWLDTGVLEGEDQLHDARRMRDLLLDRGWTRDGSLHYLEDPDGDHDEASWGRRVRRHWRELVGMLS